MSPGSFGSRLFVEFQRLLPARMLARLIHRVTRCESRWLKDRLISGFIRLYGVDVSEADAAVPAGYASFNAFFTRRLRSGARPVAADDSAVVSPADGTIQQIGTLDGDSILQVKGQYYSAAALLGDPAVAASFRGGSFATIYLAPWNYHRVHSPIAGRVVRMTHVPGELWSVNRATAEHVPGLFARNERLVCECAGPYGAFAVVLVGALNVGSISTAWAGAVLPTPPGVPAGSVHEYGNDGPVIERGGELGQFNMGSTVVLLLPPGTAAWEAGLSAGTTVRVGMQIGRMLRC
ncbi:MAG: phosphatidylserine decarboxylase [Gammaproteobacteria bacterium]|nr:phosphatidylserine decarboxylase [Gammaproteobacteria bacterium]